MITINDLSNKSINKINKKIIKKKRKKILSFKSYIKTIYVDTDRLMQKKRKKVQQDDFQILQFSEYDYILINNYNVKQLKEICKHYKQKSSGNKKELNNNCYNFLKLSYYIQKIQKVFRGHVVRYLNKLRGPALRRRKCTNETDFFTLMELKDIPEEQFISYKDKDGFIYGFDICSIYNMIVIEKMERKNPYNRSDLPKNIINNINTISKLGKLLGYKLNIVIDNKIDNLSKQKKMELETLSLFQKIDELGFITNPQWFLRLSRGLLRVYLNELIDIWNYRAQLTHEIKRKVNPQYGNPFHGFNINVILSKEKISMQKYILDIINIFITRGETSDARSLGVYYVLGALTMVSQDAANSLPWLYDSFAIINN